jgi:macrodomain Ter protein organizer (MatP/YcbG family)
MIQIQVSPTTIARLGEWAQHGKLNVNESKPGCIAVDLDVHTSLAAIANERDSTIEEALVYLLDNQ